MAARGGNRSIAGLAVPLRVWAQRFAFLLLVAIAFALMLLSKAETVVVERARLAIVDAFVPVLDVMSRPAQSAGEAIDAIDNFFFTNADNARLRRENAELARWVDLARQLELENATLRAQLSHVPDNPPNMISTRVVADAGGAFFHSVLVNAGAREYLRRGQAVVAQGGLVGRVAAVGERSARVLLLTDINSRIPVIVLSTGDRAVLAGDNSRQPKLLYLPTTAPVSPGDRVVTSGDGGLFPRGLVVGSVTEAGDGHVSVEPLVDFARLDQALVLDYGLDGVLPPPERVPARGATPAAPPK
ncbi:MAG: rod shape-determining protein MreC [Alphaproteobacteria bacterium]